MSNAFSRLVGQAESSLADVSRRAIDSVTIPVRLRSQEVIAEVTQAVTASVKMLAIKAALGVFAAVMAIIALSYALAALHRQLSVMLGPVEATLAMAGVFALLAVIAVIAMLAWPRPTPRNPEAVAIQGDIDRAAAVAKAQAAERQASKARKAVEAPAQDPDPAIDLHSGLGAIAAALGDAGFKKEQAGLRAGLALAEQLRPMQLVSLALIGGFVAGLRLARRR